MSRTRQSSSALWRRIDWPSALIVRAIVLLAGAGLLASCSKETQGSAAPKRDRTVPVTAATVATRSVPLELTTFGTVEAYATVSVRAEVTGALTGVHFRKGQELKKGDLLFTIDPRSFQAALDQAQANLARDKATEANVKSDTTRVDELFRKGVASQSEHDKAMTDVETINATVRADVAAVETARLQVEHCTIVSPIEGRAGNLLVDQGNLVRASDAVLVTINQVRPIEVCFAIAQQDLPAVRKYMAEGKLQVRAFPPHEETAPQTGELTFIDNTMDRLSGTVQLRATFANEQELLWPGQYVNVALVMTTQKDAVVIPSAAVQPGRDSKYVFVIKADKTAELRPVTVRMTYRGDSIIDTGLQPGEQVVTDGQFQLLPGSKVEFKTGRPDGAATGEAASQPAESMPVSTTRAAR